MTKLLLLASLILGATAHALAANDTSAPSLGCGDDIAELFKSLRSKDVKERREAANAIASISGLNPLPISDFLFGLDDPDAEVRHALIFALHYVNRQLGGAEDAIPQLTRLLSDSKSGTRKMAAQLLGSVGPLAQFAVPALAKAMDDPDPFVRVHAAGALADLEFGGKRPLKILADAALDKDRKLSFEAGQRLGRAGPAAVPTIVDYLKRDDADTRMRALVSVGHLAKKYKNLKKPMPAEIIREVTRAVEDRNEDIVWHALDLFISLGEAGAECVPAIQKHLHNKDWRFRLDAARALRFVGPAARASIPALKQAIAAHPEDEELVETLKRIEKGD
jgi:HEAT repeat protein